MSRLRVSLVAFAILASAACKDPNANVPRAVTTAPAVAPATPPVAAPSAGSEHLAFAPPTSTIGFTGAKVTGSHTGGFGAFTGSIDFDPARLESSRIHVDIEMNSVTTDTERLTGHLKTGDFFDVEHFPRATFESTEIRPGGANGGTHTVTGTLTLHGQARAVTFPATIIVAPTEVSARSEFVINRRDFGLVYPGMPDNLIRDEVNIRLNLRAPRGGAALAPPTPAPAAPAPAAPTPAAPVN